MFALREVVISQGTCHCESDCSFVGSSSKLQSLNTVLIAIIIFDSDLIKKTLQHDDTMQVLILRLHSGKS